MKNQVDERSRGATIGALVGAFAAVLAIALLFRSPSLDKQLARVAAEMNKSCPIMIDQDTRLDNTIALPDKVFQYNYTLIYMLKDSIDLPAFNDYMRNQIINNVRTNPQLESFRSRRVTMAYNYRDRDGVFITRIVVNPELYNN